MTRQMTNKLLEALEEGMLDPMHVILCFTSYCSEDQVAAMCQSNELFDSEEEEEDEDEPYTPLCEDCSANIIQGTLCHEHGCPETKRFFDTASEEGEDEDALG